MVFENQIYADCELNNLLPECSEKKARDLPSSLSHYLCFEKATKFMGFSLSELTQRWEETCQNSFL